MRKIKLTIEYDGSDFIGWQFQPTGRSVQEIMEKALAKIERQSTTLFASGRTDAGVHAKGMIAHFETTSNRPLSAYREGLNGHLPDSIAVVDVVEVPPGFHARFDALAKHYRYSIFQGETRSPLSGRYSWHLKRTLDVELMNQAARLLVGQHDFAAFRATGCNAKSTSREIYSARFKQHGQLLHFDITGNGFLRNMVRIIIGTLAEIGRGTRPVEDMIALLEKGDRQLSGMTAPPQGLCLMQVWYEGGPDVWIAESVSCNSCQKSLDKQW